MNWLALPTLLLGLVAYSIGLRWGRTAGSKQQTIAGWAAGVLLALPALVYAGYYSRLLGEPLWLYRWRAIPGTELLAAPAGVLAGWLQVRLIPRLTLSRMGAQVMVPCLLGFGLALPYLKPALRPVHVQQLRDTWEEGVCMQSSPSTCGPASAATILRTLGIPVTERELAQAAYSSARGTENWYLARALRRRGVAVEFLRSDLLHAPTPAIAGVKLRGYRSGHFIAILDRQGDRWVVADPLQGRSVRTLEELGEWYQFTGLFMALGRSK